MIGGYIPPKWRQTHPVSSDLSIEPFRQEVRRGCLALGGIRVSAAGEVRLRLLVHTLAPLRGGSPECLW